MTRDGPGVTQDDPWVTKDDPRVTHDVPSVTQDDPRVTKDEPPWVTLDPQSKVGKWWTFVKKKSDSQIPAKFYNNILHDNPSVLHQQKFYKVLHNMIFI